MQAENANLRNPLKKTSTAVEGTPPLRILIIALTRDILN